MYQLKETLSRNLLIQTDSPGSLAQHFLTHAGSVQRTMPLAGRKKRTREPCILVARKIQNLGATETAVRVLSLNLALRDRLACDFIHFSLLQRFNWQCTKL